jgi:calcineurin-like phosphoesterase family protein
VIYFISDNHFFHTNIIKYSNRKFNNAEEMNEHMIQQWNKTVKPQDTVYYLGDLTLSTSMDRVNSVIPRLKGQIYLIKGNHDLWVRKYKELPKNIVMVKDYYELSYNKNKIVLCHFPFEHWHNSYKGSFHLHGHCHGSIDVKNREIRRMDVGVDSENIKDYQPISIDEVFSILVSKNLSYHHERYTQDL